MKLSEKIYDARKKAGLSQEVLAERLGVSRQAVSKWETGDSEPETNKLKPLAECLGVSVDWLLSAEAPAAEAPHATSSPSQEHAAPEWLEHLPRHLGRLVKRFGWLAGLYVALYGCGMVAVALLGRMIFRQMFADVVAFAGPEFISQSPVYIITGFLFVLGLIVIAAGSILAVFLKKL